MNILEEMKMLHNYQVNNKMENPKRFYFSGDNTTIVMRSSKNALIAYSELIDGEDNCYLRMLYVPLEQRKKGIAKDILNRLIEECKLKNIRTIEVESENESIDFFKNLGFKFIFSEDKNRMRYEF